MSKKTWTTRVITLTLLCALLGGCGGGGGGSNVPSSTTTPSEEINNQTDAVADLIRTLRESSVTGTGSYAFPSSNRFHDSEGNPVRTGLVGIIDSSFSVAKLTELEGRISVVKRAGNADTTGTSGQWANGFSHGENVAMVMAGYKYGDPNIRIYAIGANNYKQEMYINGMMYQALHDVGVRIYNQSFGSAAAAPKKSDYPAGDPYIEFFREAVNPDYNNASRRYAKGADAYDTSLFIWATGNEEKNEASPDARLPRIYPELERGWIAVTAIDRSGSYSFVGANPEGRSYANAVGSDAMWWGLAAYGDYYGIGQYVGNSHTTVIAGTSFAVPAVAGAAARVQIRYPWMSAETIRLTLLTTAENKVVAGEDPATGVDAEYGWGLLDTAKALKGPAGFWKRLAYDELGNSGQDQVTITMRDSMAKGANIQQKVFYNDIKGDAGLRFAVLDDDGDGVDPDTWLILNGVNTYTGPTTVESGTLVVSNELLNSPEIEVQEKGTLVVGGLDFATGAARRARIGDQEYTVRPKIIVQPGGALKFDYGETIVYGDIEIKGDASRQGTLSVYQGGAYVKGDLTTDHANTMIKVDVSSMLQVGGDITVATGTKLGLGAMKTLDNKIIKVNDPNVLSIIVANKITGFPKTFTSADYVNDIDAGYVTINNVYSERTGGMDMINVDLVRHASWPTAKALMSYVPADVAVTGENLDRTFDALADVETPSEFKAAAASILYTPAALLPQTWDSLSGEIYASLQNLTFKQAKIVNKTLSNRLFAIASMDEAMGTGAWFDGIGNRGKIYKEGWAEGKTELWGGQAGADYAHGNKLIVGGAVSANKATAKFTQYAGQADSTNLTLSAYGTYNLGKGWYALGRIGAGFADVDVKRSIFVNPEWHPVKSSRMDTIWSAYAELGRKINVSDHFRLTPFAGISRDAVKRGDFEEEGHAFGLKGEKATFGQTAGVVGLRAQGNAGPAKLNGHVSHYAALNKEDLSFKATLPADTTGTKWDIKGVGLPRHTDWIGVGAEIEVTPKLSVNLGYDVSIERKKATDSVVTLGFRYAFK
jgi:outer membrane autotransporter protein